MLAWIGTRVNFSDPAYEGAVYCRWKVMWTLRVLIAVVVLGLTAARGGSMLDLSVPQRVTSPSLLDLSGGQPANWGVPDTDYATVAGGPAAYGTVAGSPPGPAGSPPKTQFVSGYTRKDGTHVKSYVRSSRR